MNFSTITKNFAPNTNFSLQLIAPPTNGIVPIVDKSNDIYKNKSKIFSEHRYGVTHKPVSVGNLSLQFDKEELYILRMPIRFNGVWKIPFELKCIFPFLQMCQNYQICHFGMERYPFVYLTVRHGEQRDVLTDVWHVDGFQGNYRHIPEVSYIWTTQSATEWAVQSFDIPSWFNPREHNFFKILEKQIKDENVFTSNVNEVCLFNPYMVHRKKQYKGNRSMIRLTYSPVEIKDSNYTSNPNFQLTYNKPEPRDFLL